MREPTLAENKLVDIAVQLAITAAEYMHGKTPDEVGAWAAKQLNACGFKNQPMGSSHAVLTGVDLPEEAPSQRF